MLHCRTPRSRRPAFTLLEMVLAATIGVVLMGALYVAVDYQFRHAQAGRELVERNLLARALLNRMGHEMSQSLALPGSSSTQNDASGATDTNEDSADSVIGTGMTYNRGLQGDANRVVFYFSRVPSELYQAQPNAAGDQVPATGISDLRQVTYWLSANGSGSQGLARRETRAVTSDDAVAAWSSIGDDPSAVIAEEVQSLRFRYFDGTTWQESWDASVLGPDGATPIGPPAAIEITIGIQPAGAPAGSVAAPALKNYTHRIAIPVANGTAPQATTASAP